MYKEVNFKFWFPFVMFSWGVGMAFFAEASGFVGIGIVSFFVLFGSMTALVINYAVEL